MEAEPLYSSPLWTKLSKAWTSELHRISPFVYFLADKAQLTFYEAKEKEEEKSAEEQREEGIGEER